jgi:hypothetical protein
MGYAKYLEERKTMSSRSLLSVVEDNDGLEPWNRTNNHTQKTLIMKKVLLTLMCMAVMMAASTSLKAQEVTITLNPGWTWISIPNVDTLDLATVLGTFTPMASDMIKSQTGNATYLNGQWRGTVSQFYPGHGYMYRSNRTEPVTLTLSMQQLVSQVVVTTSVPTDITTTSAVVGSTVTIGEGNHIYACGICWDTVQMPTVDDSHTSNGTNTGVFSTTLTGLTPNTTYYVRAYVVTDYGLAYGDEQSFTTLDNSSNVPEGAINGLFTINANGDQVYFSQGNLQYIGSAVTPYWKFADHQWDYIGDAQTGTSEMLDRDLFGWGTSGYNHGAICYQPWSISSYDDYFKYYAYGSYNHNLYEFTGQADWGYNAISNGGDEENLWRTLTYYEWSYVLTNRITITGIRYAEAQVNGINGLILLPDDWTNSIYVLINTNQSASFSSNIISESDWINIFQSNGAVFLPAAGERYTYSPTRVGACGYYWSASYCNEAPAYDGVYFGEGFVMSHSERRNIGHSVRLVRNAE